jgi:methyl-accepting chemotaxis protein
LEQTRALKSFSTDLAVDLQNVMDAAFESNVSGKIIPLMQSVERTTQSIIQHIDGVADKVAAPATDMIQNVVSDLKDSMSSIVEDFKSGISNSASNELEAWAQQLGSATQLLASFPQNLDNITTTLQLTIDEVKSAVSEISSTSANTSSTAMQQMQEQITFATSAISASIAEVKEVMNGISSTSQEQNSHMVNKLMETTEKMSSYMNETMQSMSSSIQTSMSSITNDVHQKQSSLIALQEDTISQTKGLLETFINGLERLEKMNEYISNTMNMFQQAQGQITGSTAHLQNITNDMKQATQLFSSSQREYTTSIQEAQRNSQQGIETIISVMKDTGEMSQEYVDKFDIIKRGISDIFAQIQSGITEYSKTVKASTQTYLDKYSTSLTDTTDALQSTISHQSEVVEMLVEALNSHKK